AGEYHHTDKVMLVTSLDRPDLGLVRFDKDLLATGRLNRENYKYGTRYYRELVSLYPDQVELIDGIINPVPLNEIVEARDGEILAWDTSLVESNEENLIPELQAYVDKSMARWYNRDYTLIEDLYWPITYATLYANIPGRIMSIRLQNCKTNYVHSHHVTRYLESYHRLGESVPYMTVEQRLWFYRNIKHIIHHVGHTSTFHTLVDKIFTDRGLPLSAYELRHNLAVGVDESKVPGVIFRRHPINSALSTDAADDRSVESLIRKEAELTG